MASTTSTLGCRYAFGKYDQLFVPEFNAGAMENAGAVTFLEDYVFRSKVTRASYERRAETMLHEMAHMWFGDLVTMTWWDDLWLNESFATCASVLCQAEATEFTEAWTTFATVEKSWAYRQDQLPSTHPIAADIPDLAAVEVNFDGITYAKGASVLKQLVAYVGLEHFLAGLRDYFRAHAFGNATLRRSARRAGEGVRPRLVDWGRQWLKTTGLNTLRPDFDVDADGKFTRFAVTQSGAAPGAGETRVHRLAIGIYDDDRHREAGAGPPGRTRRRRVQITEVPALVGVSRGKLILVNDDDLTYCSLRLDAESLRTALERIADIAEPLPRTLVWSAAWEMTREAELRPATSWRWCPAACTPKPRSGWPSGCCCRRRRRWVPTPSRVGPASMAGRNTRTGCWNWRAAPRPGRTISWRSSTRCAHRCCRPGTSRRWRAARRRPGRAGLGGPGSRHRPALAHRDRAGRRRCHRRRRTRDADIDAEVQRDPTAAGKRHGAQAAAARPQPTSKRRR